MGALDRVVGQLGEVAVGVRAVVLLQHVPDAAVQAQAARGAELLVERLAHQRV